MDCRQIADAIMRMVTSNGLYTALSQGGLAHAMRRADFAKYCNKLINIFHSFVPSSSDSEAEDMPDEAKEHESQSV